MSTISSRGKSPTYAERKASKSSAVSDDEGKDELSDHDVQHYAFEASRRLFRDTVMPQINEESSLKERLSTLERTVTTQADLNELTISMLHNIDRIMQEKEANMQRTILQLQEQILEDINTLKKDYDHRFDLQGAENRRLQARIAELKEENCQLQRKMDITASNLQALQAECGVKSDYSEEFNSLSTASLATLRSTNRFRGSTAPN